MSAFERPISSRFTWVFASSIHWPKEVPSSKGTQSRVGDPEAQAAGVQREVLDHRLVEQPEDVGARADHVALLVCERPLQGRRAAEALAALEHEHRLPGAGEVGRGGQPVVAAADDHRVPVARGEGGDRLGQADLAERRGDLVAGVEVVGAHQSASSRRASIYRSATSVSKAWTSLSSAE